MNEPRYQELLGRVLDDEINPAELGELSEAVRREPERLRDLQFDLVLWDLFSQQRQPERGADAFVAAWRTRLAAESDAPDFLARTLDQLDAGQPESTIVDEPAGPLFVPKADVSGARWLWQMFELIRGASGRRWAAGFAFATCLILIVSVGFWCLGPAMGEPVLVEVQGVGLSLERAGQLVAAPAGMRLLPGDVLRTPDHATGAIAFTPEKTRITVQPGSELKLTSMAHGKRFELKAGRVEASFARQRPFSPMILTTPQAEVRVLGTRFTLTVSTNATRLDVTEGKVRLTRANDGAAVGVAAGNYAVAAANYELLAQPLTGRIQRDFWTNLPNNYLITQLTARRDFPDHPNGHEYLDEFEGPSHRGKNYGERLYGYLHPPRTGAYTFWIAAADDARFSLSPDDNPDNKRGIAFANGTGLREWTLQPAQHSASITLVAGRKYFIEALYIQNNDDDHLAVAWQGPGRQREVIPGEFLSPLKPKPKQEKP